MSFLTLCFFLVALIYASVGFGGGSSYLALLAFFGIPYQNLPAIALLANIIVVIGGSYHFFKKGHVSWSLIWPFIVGSIPLAYIGGRIHISKELFFILLGLSLLTAGARLFFYRESTPHNSLMRRFHWIWGVAIGGVLGLVSGLVGIGGGIFLSPILLYFRFAHPKQVAAAASLFILLNSVSGLLGQLNKANALSELGNFWPLFIGVFIGGQLGSRLGSGPQISPQWIRKITALLVFLTGVKITHSGLMFYL